METEEWSGDLRDEFDRLHQAFLNIVIDWHAAEAIGDPQNLKHLNGASPGFTYVAQRAIVDRLILFLCALTEAEHAGRGPNETLPRFERLVEGSGIHALAAELREIRAGAEEHLAPMRKHRSKRLAHRDLDTARGAVLPQVLVLHLRETMKVIERWFQAVARHSNGARNVYLDALRSDVPRLVAHLRASNAFRAQDLTAWNRATN